MGAYARTPKGVENVLVEPGDEFTPCAYPKNGARTDILGHRTLALRVTNGSAIGPFGEWQTQTRNASPAEVLIILLSRLLE